MDGTADITNCSHYKWDAANSTYECAQCAAAHVLRTNGECTPIDNDLTNCSTLKLYANDGAANMCEDGNASTKRMSWGHDNAGTWAY